MEKLIIGKPKIEEVENKVRLVANIQNLKLEYLLWFEVEKEYEKYLCFEKSDAFLIAILPYAIKNELDIELRGKLSSKLYYQLTMYLIPLLCKSFNKREISIKADLDSNTLLSDNAVGAGISCGVDSFYTIMKHIDLKEKEFNLTHLTFFNVGSNGEFGGEKARELYNNRVKYVKKFALENKFKFVEVDTNISELIMMNHMGTHTFRSLSVVLALQKLFCKYYYSSGHSFNQTEINQNDTAYYDILNVQCLSNENVTFYSTGIESNRIEKIESIVNYAPSKQWLNVCNVQEINCNECEKCKRTQIALDSLGKLEEYGNVFDVKKFKKEQIKNYIFLLKQVYRKNVNYLESYGKYKSNKVKIPIIAYIIAIIIAYIPNATDIKRFIIKVARKVYSFSKKGKRNLILTWMCSLMPKKFKHSIKMKINSTWE